MSQRLPNSPSYKQRRTSIAVQRSRVLTVVVMRGEFDLAARRELDREVRDLLDDAPADLVLDMSGVEFMDSTWVAVLVHLWTRADGEGRGRMRIRAASPIAARALEVTGLSALCGFEVMA